MKYLLGIIALAYFGKSCHHIKPMNFDIKSFIKFKN